MTFQSLPAQGRQLELASVITLVVVITIVLISVFCVSRYLAQKSGDDDAPRSPSMTTPMKTGLNSGAGYGEPESEETESEEGEGEKECDKAQDKPLHNYTGWLEYVEQETWVIWQRPLLKRRISNIKYCA
jgi:hypothetical protein